MTAPLQPAPCAFLPPKGDRNCKKRIQIRNYYNFFGFDSRNLM